MSNFQIRRDSRGNSTAQTKGSFVNLVVSNQLSVDKITSETLEIDGSLCINQNLYVETIAPKIDHITINGSLCITQNLLVDTIEPKTSGPIIINSDIETENIEAGDISANDLIFQSNIRFGDFNSSDRVLYIPNNNTNLVVGKNSAAPNTDNNTIIGKDALKNYVDLLSSQGRNTAIGSESGSAFQQGSRNTFIGNDSGKTLVFGSNNIFINSNPSGTTKSNVIQISSDDDSNTGDIIIGDSKHTGQIYLGTDATSCQVGGIFGKATIDMGSTTSVMVDNFGRLGTVSSSRRFKENIAPIGKESKDIYKLKPVKFNYIEDENKNQKYGLIAEESDKVLPQITIHNSDGEIQGVDYLSIVPLLLNEVRRLRRDMLKLKKKMTS